MSSETERRVENLLDSSTGPEKIDSYSGTSVRSAKQSPQESNKTNGVSVLENDSAKKALSVELKERQEKQKVLTYILFVSSFILRSYFCV